MAGTRIWILSYFDGGIWEDRNWDLRGRRESGGGGGGIRIEFCSDRGDTKKKNLVFKVEGTKIKTGLLVLGEVGGVLRHASRFFWDALKLYVRPF